MNDEAIIEFTFAPNDVVIEINQYKPTTYFVSIQLVSHTQSVDLVGCDDTSQAYNYSVWQNVSGTSYDRTQYNTAYRFQLQYTLSFCCQYQVRFLIIMFVTVKQHQKINRIFFFRKFVLRPMTV